MKDCAVTRLKDTSLPLWARVGLWLSLKPCPLEKLGDFIIDIGMALLMNSIVRLLVRRLKEKGDNGNACNSNKD